MTTLLPWTIPPDWAAGVRETLTWLTDVMQSQSGAEQRMQMRLSPRRMVEFDFNCYRQQRTLFDLCMTQGGGSDWLLPLWWDGAVVTGQFGAGSPAIGAAVSTDATNPTELLAGSQVLICTDPFTYEVLTLQAVASSALTFTSPTTKAWSKGAKVYPVRPARLTDQPSILKKTSRAASGTIRFQMTQNNDYPAAYPPVGNYNNVPVLLNGGNERDDSDFSWERLIVDFDDTISTVLRTDTAGIGFTKQTLANFTQGRAAHAQFRSLLYALCGQLNTVYLPTFNDDFELIDSTPGGTMDVRMCGYSQFGWLTTGRSDIMIRMTDGSNFYSAITGSEIIDSDTERLHLSVQNFGKPVTPQNVAQICFMARSRLAADSVDILHQTDSFGVSECVLTFRSTPENRHVV